MDPFEYGKHLPDLLQIEGFPDKPGMMPLQRGSDRPVADPVQVHLAFRVEPGMKTWIDFPQLPDNDVRGQQAIDSHQNISLAQGRGRHKTCDLAEGMDPGVRPPGAVDADILSRHPGQAGFENLLDRKAVGLKLPSAIRSPVIFDGNPDIPHIFSFLCSEGQGLFDPV